MAFNKLLLLLANKLSENGLIFKEIKSQSAKAYGIPELEQCQLPSCFFSKLISYKYIGQRKLGHLYMIYQTSNLDHAAKEEAYRCIEEFNFNNLSMEATTVLKHIVSEILLQPISTTEIQRLADKVPTEHRTPDMQYDQKSSIMKLKELNIFHAFDINVLYEVFKNNQNIVKNIIDPNWNRIKSLYSVYCENKKPPEVMTRPKDVQIISPGSPGQQPSPVEQYSPEMMPHLWRTHPIAPRTEPIPIYRPYSGSPVTNMDFHMPRRNSPPIQPNSQPNVTHIPMPTYMNIPMTPIDHTFVQGLTPPPALDSMEDSILFDNVYDIPNRDISKNVYPGECVIINIEKFSDPGIRDRIGSIQDVDNIRKTFEQLKFKVNIKQNLTSEEIMDYVQMRAKDTSLYNVGVFVCFLMSHGEEGMISGSDGKHVEIETIINSFKNDKCAALKGKPKVFFVQACRGSIVDAPLNGLMADNFQTESKNVSAQPQDADLMVCQATTKGKVAVRTDTGSWYIDTVCYVITKTYRFEDLNGMHTKINNRISSLGANGASTLQVSNVNQSLRKKVKFCPNILAEEFIKNNPVNLKPKFLAVQ